MWIVCFSGGLGNQMFQYAFYKALMHHYPSMEIQADIFNVLGPEQHNGYELEKIFGIQMRRCSKNVALARADYCIRYAMKYKVYGFAYRIRKKLLGNKKTSVIQNTATSYMPEIFVLNQRMRYIFMGNWINEKYFWDISNELKKEFKFPAFADKKNVEYEKMMERTQSVSIHVRRTDYLDFDFCILDLDYYMRAIEEIEKRVDHPVYFIFSDDTEYVKKKFASLKNKVYIEGNQGENSYKDMQLMSCCKHNILANSTFSYWGAFLNANSDKVVIEPSHISKEMRFPKVCDNTIYLECL